MSISLILLIWGYSLFFGWPFAVCLGLILFVHEMGHVIAAKCLGMPVSAPMFIPFFGAYTSAQQPPQDAWTGALFAMGGPLAGVLAGWIVMLLGFYLQMPWIVAVASVNFIINMFNMIPVPPFDGGGMTAAVSRWFWLVGLVMLLLALVYFHSFYTSIFLVIIIVLFTLPRLRHTFFDEPTEDEEMYYATHISNRLTMALIYLGILAALMLGYGHSSGYLTPIVHPAAAVETDSNSQ